MMPPDALQRALLAWEQRDRNRDALRGCPLERAIESGQWSRDLKIHNPMQRTQDWPQRCTN